MNNELVGIALCVGLLWGGIAFAILPSAFDTELSNDRAANLMHQYDNKENKQDLDDEVVYQASDKAQTIKYANDSLRKIKSGEL